MSEVGRMSMLPKSRRFFSVNTAALGRLAGRHLTVGHITGTWSWANRDARRLFDHYLKSLWPLDAAPESKIGSEGAQRLSESDREAIANAYLTEYHPEKLPEVGEKKASEIVGELFLEQARVLDESLKNISSHTFFSPNTAELLQRSKESSEYIEKVTGWLRGFEALSGQPVRGSNWQKSLELLRRAQPAMPPPPADHEEASGTAAEQQAAQEVAEIAAANSPEVLAGLALDRVNRLADSVEGALVDWAKHRQSAEKQFKVQVWLAVIALVVSALLGAASFVTDVVGQSSEGHANYEVVSRLDAVIDAEQSNLAEMRQAEARQRKLLEQLTTFLEKKPATAGDNAIAEHPQGADAIPPKPSK